MTIEAIGAVEAATTLFETTARAAPDATAFANTLDGIQSLNTTMVENEAAIQSLALGDTDNLHRVMMSVEGARMQLDLLLQVRNKMLDAYQELMRMQV